MIFFEEDSEFPSEEEIQIFTNEVLSLTRQEYDMMDEDERENEYANDSLTDMIEGHAYAVVAFDKFKDFPLEAETEDGDCLLDVIVSRVRDMIDGGEGYDNDEFED